MSTSRVSCSAVRDQDRYVGFKERIRVKQPASGADKDVYTG